MNVTILTYGSRGDIQPFLPLSLGLIARGHSVKLAAPRRFKELIEGYGIHFVPLAGDPEDLVRRFNDAGFNFLAMLREMISHATDIGIDVMRQTEEHCANADLIIHTFAHAVGAHTVARKKNIPDVHVQLFPLFSPTGDYPNVTMPNFGFRALNRMSHVVSSKLTWVISRLGFEYVRRRAGLPKQKLYFPFDQDSLRPPTPILCAWSPSILPASSDWEPHVHVTGNYFFDLNTTHQPTVELQSFLDAGNAPVCISFGSMVNRDAKKIDHIVRQALNRTHQRGIILSGWGKVEHPSSDDLLYLEAVPHDWLLPRCKMVVHHGGAGTTSAGLRAGIPNIVVPFTADQPFWGNRVHAIGAGPKPILVKNLSVERLTDAIVEAGSKSLRERAESIGQKIRSEDGVGQAVQFIEGYAS